MDSNNHTNENNSTDAAATTTTEPTVTVEQTIETIAPGVKGCVKWFHRVRGFGFITRDDTKEDVFVHCTGLKQDETDSSNKRRNKRRLNLMDNEKVIFDVVKVNGDKLEARNVIGRSGYLIVDLIAYKRGIRPIGLEIVNEQRQTGKVKSFNVKSRNGLIINDANNEEIYVHAHAIINNNPNKYKPSLNDGEVVEFDIMKKNDGKFEAVNVTGPQGVAVQGSVEAPDKTDKSQQPIVESNLTGTVKWFNVKAGFGFITMTKSDSTTADVYVHHSSIKTKNPNHRFRSLADGETITFNLIEGSKGPEAVDVTGPDGSPVQGSQYVRPPNKGRRLGPRRGYRRSGNGNPNSSQNNESGGDMPRSRSRGQRMGPPQQGPPPNRMMNRPPRVMMRPQRPRNMGGKMYPKNPYNNENFNNDDQMNFKSRNKQFYDNQPPRRSMPFNKNMMNGPGHQGPMRRGPPPMYRNQPPMMMGDMEPSGKVFRRSRRAPPAAN